MKSINPILILFIALTTLLGNFPGRVKAQASQEGWQLPVNLSNSGGVANPNIVVDSNGIAHAFWEDLYADMVYSRNSGEGWSEPVHFDLPFNNTNYLLLADWRGRLYAFWIDSEQNFAYSRVTASNADNQNSWEPAVQLASEVVGFDVSVDANSKVHAVFVLAASGENIAGVYTLSTFQDTSTFSTPRLLYASRYYRTLLPPPGTELPPGTMAGQLPAVSVSARAVGDSSVVLVGWDDAALKRSFYARSVDGGENFSEPVLLDGPQTLPSYLVPQNVKIHYDDNGLLVLWERSDPLGASCSQRYIFSPDGGETWTHEGELWNDFNVCPEKLRFLSTGRPSLVFALIQGQVFLTAFIEGQWSRVHNQIELSDLNNPQTREIIDLNCQQAALRGDELFVIGCDSRSGGDVWTISRFLGSISSWFEPRSNWLHPVTIPAGSDVIRNLQVVVGTNAMTYAMWMGVEAELTTDEIPGLQVASWKGEGLALGPFEIHKIRNGFPDRLDSVYLPAANRIVSVWQAGQVGEVYSSWSSASDAINRTNWSSPELIHQSDPQSFFPTLLAGNGSQMEIVYAIPFNEKRGVYLSKSADSGQTWEGGRQIASGSALGCQGIQDPQASKYEESIHVLFTCTTLPGGIGPLALYYLRTTDGGQTWSPIQLVAEQRVTWSKIIVIHENLLYRVWKETQPENDRFSFSISTDNGSSWSAPANFFTSEVELNQLDLVADPAGGLHLLTAFQTLENEPPRLEYLFWNGTIWERGQSFEFDHRSASSITALSAGILNNETLMVVLAGRVRNEITAMSESRIFFTSLPVEIDAQPIEIIVPEVTPTIEIAPTDEIIVEPTENLEFSRQPGGGGVPPWTGIVAGGALAVILIAGVMVYTRFIRKPEK